MICVVEDEDINPRLMSIKQFEGRNEYLLMCMVLGCEEKEEKKRY